MLSLPPITPRPDATLFPSNRMSTSSFDDAASDRQNPHRPDGQRGHHSRQASHGSGTRSMLASLAADENVIAQRKQNVRRFGAGWIRPPGVAKTYQAIMDEAAEREEHELLARREQILLDLAAAQTQAEARNEAEQGEDEVGEEEERDLDEDVPDAEEEEDSDVSSEDEEDSSEAPEGDTVEENTQGGEGDMTFNEGSFIEGSMMAAEVDQMLEREEAELEGVLQDERDLDDDIPEAGSYEHTDTELIDSSSGAEDASVGPGGSFISGAGRRDSGRRISGGRASANNRRVSGRGSFALAQAGRLSIDTQESSSIMESSFLHSSPAAARGAGIASTFRSRFAGSRPGRS